MKRYVYRFVWKDKKGIYQVKFLEARSFEEAKKSFEESWGSFEDQKVVMERIHA